MNPVHALVVVNKTFPPQKDMDEPKPIPYPYGSYLVNPHAYNSSLRPLRHVVENLLCSSIKLIQRFMVILYSIWLLPAISRFPDGFSAFFNTSCSICLSRLMSATSFLSFEFSYSRFLSLRS